MWSFRSYIWSKYSNVDAKYVTNVYSNLPYLLHHREEMANIKCPVEINVEMLSIRDFLHVKDGKK